MGKRWALLILRDLLVSDQRFSDLKRGLPRIPTNILTNRLTALQDAGIIERKLLDTPRKTVVYTLTEYGRGLEEIVLALGRWGAQLLGEVHPDEIVTPESLVMALRSTFRPEAAAKNSASFEIRVGNEIVLHALIHEGKAQRPTRSVPWRAIDYYNRTGNSRSHGGIDSASDRRVLRCGVSERRRVAV